MTQIISYPELHVILSNKHILKCHKLGVSSIFGHGQEVRTENITYIDTN